MTPQEAIETIKIAIAEVEWNYPMDYAVAFEKAIEALEKQIPKKNKIIDEKYTRNFIFGCANCNEPVKFPQKYCAYCGQALDWSEIK